MQPPLVLSKEDIMSGITDPPNEYSFGLDFNYAAWPIESSLSFVNVPWDNTYRDIVRFADRNALNAYIDSREVAAGRLESVSYLKPNQPIRVDIPFNAAYRYNYLRVTNPLQPVPGDVLKAYYYFILDVRYIAPETTEIVVQLDVWQTFGYDITPGNSYVERGHVGIANSNSFTNYGRDYLTVPEGLDVGGEYIVSARKRDVVMRLNSADILIVSSIDLTANAGTVEDPKLSTAKGGQLQGLPSGASFYIAPSAEHLVALMIGLSNKPWISQGIMSITAIPDLGRYNYQTVDITVAGVALKQLELGSSRVGRGKYTDMFTNWRNSPELLNDIPERYRKLKKLFTYPYMVIEMTAWGATPIILKPESWADPNARISEKAAVVPPNQRIAFYPTRYNAKPDSIIDSRSVGSGGPLTTEYYDDGGDYLDKTTQISNFPSFPIVNNMAIAYLASNANSIAYQNSAADWSQQRALGSNQVGYDQASSAINTSRDINAQQRGASSALLASDQLGQTQGFAANSIANILNGGVGGAMAGAGVGAAVGLAGGIGGTIAGAVNMNINMDTQNRGNAINNQLSAGINDSQNQQAMLMRDSNKQLADWAARGDYAQSIAGINAKVQDAMLTQPSSSGQMGGEAFNLIHDNVEISLRWKRIDNAATAAVGEFWLRYGYAVRRFTVPPTDFMVMTKATYWKLQEMYISTGDMPEGFRQAIRGIFEKGVTVWRDPNDIGNIDFATNEPLEGITL